MSILQNLSSLWREEAGDAAVETAVLLPVFFILFGFMQNSFLHYEGLNAVTLAVNEAMRFAVTAEDQDQSLERAKQTLTDRLKTLKMGWCDSDCGFWEIEGKPLESRDLFENTPDAKMLYTTDKGWCEGSKITMGVRAHKSSLLPDFKSFRSLIMGKPGYNEYTYVITARVETKTKCS